MSIYAIVETGGKQYRVKPGDVIEVELLKNAEPGETIDLGNVLLVSDNGDVKVGSPTVHGASVAAKVETEGKSKKVTVFKYKPKIRYRRKIGHRQRFSRLAIEDIRLS